MTNFDKCKQVFIEEDMLMSGFCNAIRKIRNEKNCYDRQCENCVKWLKQEYKPEILDKAEKEYLSAVIKPFRKRVIYISKFTSSDDFVCIEIELNDGDCAALPYFKVDTMYKGMKLDKKYTLKELGL